MDHKAKAYNQELTDRITQLLDEGTPPWQKPWKGVSPYNPVTSSVYGGSNKFILMCYGFEDPRFLTFNGIKSLGGAIKPDAFKVTVSGREKPFSGIPVRHKPYPKKLDTGEIDEQGKPIYIYQQQYTAPKYSRVWNITQTDLVDKELDTSIPVIHEELTDAETLAKNYLINNNIRLNVGAFDRAFYTPSTDQITIPDKQYFKGNKNSTGIEEYYSTLFHEISHSTGNKSRLNRDTFGQANHFGSDLYGYEELIAEFGNTFLCGKTGIHTTINNSASYINSWKKTINANINLVAKASSEAQKVYDYVIKTSEDITKSNILPVRFDGKIKDLKKVLV